MKRILLTAMALILCVSGITLMPLEVGAAASAIDGAAGGKWLEDNWSIGQSGDWDNLEVTVGDEIRIPLTADLFTWDDGRTPLPNEAVTMNQLKNGRVKVRTRVRSGSTALNYVQFDVDSFDGRPFFAPGSTSRTNRTAHISIFFADPFLYTKDIDFDFTVYLTIEGASYEELEINISGTLAVEEEELEEGCDFVDLRSGVVAVPLANLKDVEIKLEQGLTIKTNMTDNKRYYAYVQRVDGQGGIEKEYPLLPNAYPEISSVFRLHGLGFNENARMIIDPFYRDKQDSKPDRDFSYKEETDIDGDEKNRTFYYVYGEGLVYLGTTKQELPYSNIYFISTKRISELELENEEIEYITAPARMPSGK